MKILFLVHRIPYPPNKGDKIRSFHILKHLAKQHQVSLACLVDSKDDLKYIDELKRFCYSIDWEYVDLRTRRFFSLYALFSGKPLSVACFYSQRLQKKVNSRLANNSFDLIFTYSVQMAEYVKNIKKQKRVMDFVDMDSRKWSQYARFQSNPVLSWLYRFEAHRLIKYEINTVREFDLSLFVSPAEALPLKQRTRCFDKIHAVHNGVDTEFFAPGEAEKNGKSSDERIILFTGAMDYYPNIDAVRWFRQEVLPQIKTNIPGVRFYIVGSNPAREVKRLHNGTDVVVTGYVEDIRRYFDKADVFVAPFRIACGIQNKILEALSMGLPVVATSIGAEGLKQIDCPVVVRDQANAFAEQATLALSRVTQRSKMQNRYRNWVIRNYNWQQNLSEMDRLYTDALFS